MFAIKSLFCVIFVISTKGDAAALSEPSSICSPQAAHSGNTVPCSRPGDTVPSFPDIITPLKRGPGIYFDPIGTTRIINGHLSVIIPLDLSFIDPHLNNIDSVLRSTRELCNTSKAFEPAECANIIQPLEIRLADMLRDYDSVSHLLTRRTKRSAWFGFVGTASKHLFGTMDEDDAISYSKAVQSLESDQKNLASYMKQSILVTTTTLKSFNQTIIRLVQNQKSMNEAVDALTENLKSVTRTSAVLTIKSRFMEIVNILENSILTLSFKLEDIANGLMFSKNNILYPAICSPKELYNDLVENYRYLPSSKELPIVLDLSSVHTLMEISSISSYYVDRKIIFVVKIPLVNSQEFNLYQALPLPIAYKNNTYAAIIPGAAYIGFSRHANQYVRINNLKECKAINHNYICDNTNILSSIAYPICESEIVSKTLNYAPKECPVKLVRGKDIEIWQELQDNDWIFVIARESKFTLDCLNDNVYETSVFGTGIIKIPVGCTGYCNGIEIPSKESLKINVTRINIDFNIIASNLSVREIPEITYSHPEVRNVKHLSFQPLLDYKENFDVMNEKLENFIEKPRINLDNVDHYYIPTIVYCILGIMCLYICYNLYRFCQGRRYLKPRYVVAQPTSDLHFGNPNIHV